MSFCWCTAKVATCYFINMKKNAFTTHRDVSVVIFLLAGGNCQTAMIATISMEPVNLAESLSTCRFAQRVACITNTLR